MGPGPSDVSPRVLEAMARPTIGHLDPEFVTFMDDLKRLLRFALRTENQLTIPISAPGSAGMEAAVVNIVEPGDKVVVCINGVFGNRLREVVSRAGGEVISVEFDWGTAVDPAAVEAALKKAGTRAGKVKVVAFVHAETSTGVASDAAALCRIAREHGALSLVDAVTSVGGIDVDVDGWGIDILYSGTQKCLSAPPGLSPLTFSPAAVEVVKARRTPVQSWFLDLTLVMAYWGSPDGKDGSAPRTYHHTAPVNALYGLHEALVILEEEGLEASWARHARMHGALKAGLEAMGLGLYVEEACRLPQLNAVTIPDGVDEAMVRKHLLDNFSLEIGAGLGALAGKVWRIGLMGASARPDRVLLCLEALEDALMHQQAGINTGAAIAAAKAALDG